MDFFDPSLGRRYGKESWYGANFLDELGRHYSLIADDTRGTVFLHQLNSVVIPLCNASCLLGSFFTPSRPCHMTTSNALIYANDSLRITSSTCHVATGEAGFVKEKSLIIL